MKLKTACTLLLPLLICSNLLMAQDNLKHFDPMDVFELEWANDPQVSPDGKTIIYVRQSNDVMKDRTQSHLWQINADGSNHEPLLTGQPNASSPRWSPNGKQVAYLSNESGSRQIHLLWMDSGKTSVITQVQESPSNLSWTPDDKWLAFTMSVQSPTKPIAKPRT